MALLSLMSVTDAQTHNTLTLAALVSSQVPASSEEDIRVTRQPRQLPTPQPWVQLRPASLLWQAAALPAPMRMCHGKRIMALAANAAS